MFKPVFIDADSKFCTKCQNVKSKNEFTKQKLRKDGLYPFCRYCLCNENLIYKRSFIGVINQMYSDMKKRVSTPKYIYWYGKSILSKQKFEYWIKRNNKFKRLFNIWKNKDYNNMIKPSIDRINSNEGYILGNIQILLNEENRTKARNKRWYNEHSNNRS